MRFMEGHCRPETHPPPSSAEIGFAKELSRWNSDASTLTAENCENVMHRSGNVKPNDRTTWTDEKHSLYLEHLEVSFVKQLHQSMGLLAQCSDLNKREDKNVCQLRPRVYHLSSDMPGYSTPCGTENYWKVITSHGLETCSQQFSASSRYHGDLNFILVDNLVFFFVFS
ncbi:hypothetical protein DH2020_045281 [Rehmannia glutinosa]|uniref:Uncharacterized protein n=1 Tax=Rehmannia glutinosa TaxID=99300 RepID=A0ABR0UG88_REHGL